MDNNFKIKFIIGFFIAMALLIGCYFLYTVYNSEKLKKENFKFYNNYNFVENNVLKSDLVDDAYILNLLSMDNYNEFDEYNLEELMVYYVKNITKNTSEDIKLSKNSLSFNLSKDAFIKSMKELFNVDVSDIYNNFGVVSFIEVTSDRIYFNIRNSLISSDNGYLLGIKSIYTENEITTIDTYIYTFMVDSEDAEKNLKNKVVEGINMNNFTEINKLMESYGTYKEKVISFRQIPNGDFFKYQIISIQTK